MKTTLKTFLVLGIIGISSFAFAQDNNSAQHDITINIPEVALLDIEGGSGLTLGPDAPTEAGEALNFSAQTDNTLWLNYSSIIGSTNEPTRKITVAISSGTLPGGMTLNVSAGSHSGTGGGTFGTPVGSGVDLSTTDQDLITGIGSAWTGDGPNNGHNLTYTLSLSASGDYGNLDFDDATTITVTYTLTDN